MNRLVPVLLVVGSLVLLGATAAGQTPFGLPEALAFVTGAACVWLTVKEHVWNWPIGIANSAFFVVLFWQTRLYADMGLQVVYIVLGFLGWYWWLHGGADRGVLHVARTPIRWAVLLAVVGVAATAAMTLFLERTNDAAPFWDALTTVLSLIAQFMLTKKLIENWFVWLTADLIYIALYAAKGLGLTSILYAIFFILCIAGLRT